VLHQFKPKDVLYLIDESVSDVATIVGELPASAEVKIISLGEDGVAQVLATLAGKCDLSAIHIVSHGRPGAIVLGATAVDTNTLTSRVEDFIAIGRALACDADLLIYGCRVAEGEVGKAFLAKLSDLTGANVAASETLTGAAHLGGDWNLEVRLGNVHASILNIPSYAGVLPAPTITIPSSISYTEGDAAQPIGSNIKFENGSGYAGGSITFEVSGATANDQMTLFSDVDPNAAGAISVDGRNVYLGDGTGRKLIGEVDETENGQNGQPLTIHLIGESTNAITNPSFEGSTSGWTISNSRVILGTTAINGHVTPEDLTAPANSRNGAGGGIDNGNIASMTYNNQLATDQHTDGANSLRLYLSGTTADGYDVVHGPSAYSNTFAAQAGDVFAFDWRAAAGGDAYDAFGYLMSADTGEYVRVLDATGKDNTGVTDWASQEVVVPKSGNWFFVFVSGTYDFTGGRQVGGSLYIDNFRVERSLVNDNVLGELAKHVQYKNTSEAPPDAPRSFTIEVKDGTGDTETANTTIDITPVNDAPLVSGEVAGTATEGGTGVTLDALKNASDVDTGDVLTVVDVGTLPAGVTYDPTTHSFTLDPTHPAYQSLAAGATQTVSVEYNVSDGTTKVPASVSWTVTGTNDAAQLSADVANLTEGDTAAAISTSGQLTITDVDSPATFVAQSNVVGDYGTFSIGTDGKWTYAASSAHDEFQAGQTYTDTFTVTSADGTTTTVTVNLTGTNDTASGGVDVIGEPTQGKVLTATNDVVDPEGIDPPSVAYQWQRRQPDGSWVNIIGATGANYALTQDDVDAGHVRAVMSYTDLGGTSETVAGNAIPVANANDAPTGAVTITGEAREGQPLTAVNTLADEDGLGSLTYQWLADGVAIEGATGATFTLTPDQVGKAITVVISYTDGYGTPESVTSPASSVVVNGNAGDDQFYGGSSNDELYGGTGEDRLYGYGGRDRLYGEAGNDTIDGGADNDTVYGGSGDDQLFGNSGKDRLYGNEGRDKLSGGASNDTVSGGAENDTVDGGSGNDRLYGDSGNDALKGGSGNDWIVGGLGRDKLYGGAGADVFDFNSTQESRVGSQRDTIYDFQSGRDLVDLRGIDANELRKGNQAFTWSCMDVAFVNPDEADASLLKTGFTGKAGQLRYDRGILMGDTDGDRKADFQIKIVGHFTGGDLLL